jgi:thioredoxin reductase (NADPH)
LYATVAAPGGEVGTLSRIENYAGFPSGVSGEELASRALRQARRVGAAIIVTRSVTRTDAATRHVYLDGGDVLRAQTILLGCGVAWRQLSIPGFDRFSGKGRLVRRGGRRGGEHPRSNIHIADAGNSAGRPALFFSNLRAA